MTTRIHTLHSFSSGHMVASAQRFRRSSAAPRACRGPARVRAERWLRAAPRGGRPRAAVGGPRCSLRPPRPSPAPAMGAPCGPCVGGAESRILLSRATVPSRTPPLLGGVAVPPHRQSPGGRDRHRPAPARRGCHGRGRRRAGAAGGDGLGGGVGGGAACRARASSGAGGGGGGGGRRRGHACCDAVVALSVSPRRRQAGVDGSRPNFRGLCFPSTHRASP